MIRYTVPSYEGEGRLVDKVCEKIIEAEPHSEQANTLEAKIGVALIQMSVRGDRLIRIDEVTES